VSTDVDLVNLNFNFRITRYSYKYNITVFTLTTSSPYITDITVIKESLSNEVSKDDENDSEQGLLLSRSVNDYIQVTATALLLRLWKLSVKSCSSL
jgi:hypothetical protein